jgi:hypothetical protein
MDNLPIVTHNHHRARQAVFSDRLIHRRIDGLGTRKRLRSQRAGREGEE